MTEAVSAVLVNLSWLVAAAALVAGVGAVLATRSLLPSVGVFLDLLLAAGLLRLATGGTWQALAGAAAIVVIRKLVVFGLRSNGGRLPPTGRVPRGGGGAPKGAPTRPVVGQPS